jgi:small subunit ribosomal protein S9
MAEKKDTTKKKVEDTPAEETATKPLKKGFISGTGRRKTSVARVFLWETKGDFIVNGKKFDEYFPDETDKIKWEKPFHTIGVSHPEAKFSASIKVSGSGKSSQLDAIILGISRALSKIDGEYDTSLRRQGLLTRDSRMVERKKPYLRKARKRPQYSKR